MSDKLNCLFLLPTKFRKGISQITKTFSFTFTLHSFGATRILINALLSARLSPREFGHSPARFSGLVRPSVYSPGVLAWDGKGLLKLIYVYYGVREK